MGVCVCVCVCIFVVTDVVMVGVTEVGSCMAWVVCEVSGECVCVGVWDLIKNVLGQLRQSVCLVAVWFVVGSVSVSVLRCLCCLVCTIFDASEIYNLTPKCMDRLITTRSTLPT